MKWEVCQEMTLTVVEARSNKEITISGDRSFGNIHTRFFLNLVRTLGNGFSVRVGLRNRTSKAISWVNVYGKITDESIHGSLCNAVEYNVDRDNGCDLLFMGPHGVTYTAKSITFVDERSIASDTREADDVQVSPPGINFREAGLRDNF